MRKALAWLSCPRTSPAPRILSLPDPAEPMELIFIRSASKEQWIKHKKRLYLISTGLRDRKMDLTSLFEESWQRHILHFAFSHGWLSKTLEFKPKLRGKKEENKIENLESNGWLWFRILVILWLNWRSHLFYKERKLIDLRNWKLKEKSKEPSQGWQMVYL